MENENAIIFRADEIRPEDNPVTKPITGTLYEQMLLDDPDTGMTVEKIIYPAGFNVPLHTHNCSHGFYILKGTLITSEGNYGPGSFVWFKEGAQMVHGAGDEPIEAICFANKPFDLTFADQDIKGGTV